MVRQDARVAYRVGSCLRRNDGKGVAWAMRGSGVGDRGAYNRWRQLGIPTPHLTSPLRGGRDELGREADLEGSVHTLWGWRN